MGVRVAPRLLTLVVWTVSLTVKQPPVERQSGVQLSYGPPSNKEFLVSCKCALCQRNAKVKTVLKSGTVEELRSMVKDLSEELMCTELDRDVFEAKLLGKWPSMDQ